MPPATDLVPPAALQRTPLLADPPAVLHLLGSVDRLRPGAARDTMRRAG